MNTEHNKISLTKMDTPVCIWKRLIQDRKGVLLPGNKYRFTRKIFIVDEKERNIGVINLVIIIHGSIIILIIS